MEHPYLIQNLKSKIQNRDGFTLIELLVVVAIIAILVGLIVPALGQARKQSGQVVCASNLKNIGMAFDYYRQDYRDIYPCANDPVHSVKNWWLWMGRGFRPVLEPYIAPNLSAKNPNVLWCPQDPSPENKYENTSYAYAMSFYHSSTQINSMNDKSFTYSNPKPGVAVSSGKVTFPARKILAGEWLSAHQSIAGADPGWWGWLGTRNFVFPDGHAEFVPSRKIRPANDNLPDPNLTIDGVEGTDL